MFERFTTEARGVVVEAQHEARHLNHAYVGTEHLLLALLRPDSGQPHAALTEAGLTADAARISIARFLEQSTSDTSSALGEDDAAALEAIGIDLDAIRAKIEESFGPGALDPPPALQRGLFRRKSKPARVGGHLPFTGRAKKVLELSLREAVALRHNRIGTEHILLGLLREGNGLAARVIHDASIDPADLRRRTIASLTQAA